MNTMQFRTLCVCLALTPGVYAQAQPSITHKASGVIGNTDTTWNHSLTASHAGYTVSTNFLVEGWRLAARVGNEGMVSPSAAVDWYDTRFMVTAETSFTKGAVGISAVSDGDDGRLTFDLSYRPFKKWSITTSSYATTTTLNRFGVEATATWQVGRSFMWQLQSNYVHRLVFDWTQNELVLKQGLHYQPPYASWRIALDHQKDFSGQGNNRLLVRFEWRF